MYEIRYLPLARKDLHEIISYITEQLKAPKAALDLLDAFDEAINHLRKFPYSYKVYQNFKPLEDEYRVLRVKNYLIFYVVKDNIVEIRRIIYEKRGITRVIK